jgi:hypothetical protein
VNNYRRFHSKGRVSHTFGALILCCSSPVNCILENLSKNYVNPVYFTQPLWCFAIYIIVNFHKVTFCRRTKRTQNFGPHIMWRRCRCRFRSWHGWHFSYMLVLLLLLLLLLLLRYYCLFCCVCFIFVVFIVRCYFCGVVSVIGHWTVDLAH